MNNIEIFSRQLAKDTDGIYNYPFEIDDQVDEMTLRRSVSGHTDIDHMEIISKSHSIPVMDRELNSYLTNIPKNGIVLDVGGGWGWHFRNIHVQRPDITVIILDAVKENLLLSKLLFPELGKKAIFVHGTALDLPIKSEIISGYWSVQTLQHIPRFTDAVDEAYRVCKKGAVFASYSLQSQKHVSLIYGIMKLKFKPVDPSTSFYIAKASKQQFEYINEKFNYTAGKRFTEFLYNPSLKLIRPGKEGSVLGMIDSRCSTTNRLLGHLARQVGIIAIR